MVSARQTGVSYSLFQSWHCSGIAVASATSRLASAGAAACVAVDISFFGFLLGTRIASGGCRKLTCMRCDAFWERFAQMCARCSESEMQIRFRHLGCFFCRSEWDGTCFFGPGGEVPALQCPR